MLTDNDAMATIAVKDMAAARKFYEGTLRFKRSGGDEEVDVVIGPLPRRVVEPQPDRRPLHEQIRDVVRVERRDHLDRDRVESERHAHDLRSLETVMHQY